MTYKTLSSRMASSLFNTMAALGLALGVATQAHAEIELSISSGGNTVVCRDNPIHVMPTCTVTAGTASLVSGDLDARVDHILGISMNLGAWSTVQLNASGAAIAHPFLQTISSFAATTASQTVETLEIKFTQFDLSAAPASSSTLATWLDGGLIGSDALGADADTFVDYKMYADSTNAKYGTQQLLAQLDNIQGVLDANDNTRIGTAVGLTGPFSVTQVFNISHGAGTRNTAFTSVVAASEPAIFGLLAFGLLLTAMGRRKS